MNDPRSSSAPCINFQGEQGIKRAIKILKEETILGDGQGLEDLWSECKLIEKETGETLIQQGQYDCNIFFIICGSFEMIVNGRSISKRDAGDHVGEIGLFSPNKVKTATARALERSCVLECSEHNFRHYAQINPSVWEQLAKNLGRRLRARMSEVLGRREVPNVVLFSTSEAVSVAEAIKLGLDHKPLFAKVWTELFSPGGIAIDEIREEVQNSDFAIVILTGDDRTICRDKESVSPRDNLVLELGLSIGILGRRRTFIVKTRGAAIKIPTDILGVTEVDYVAGTEETLQSRLGNVCTTIWTQVDKLRAR